MREGESRRDVTNRTNRMINELICQSSSECIYKVITKWTYHYGDSILQIFTSFLHTIATCVLLVSTNHPHFELRAGEQIAFSDITEPVISLFQPSVKPFNLSNFRQNIDH